MSSLLSFVIPKHFELAPLINTIQLEGESTFGGKNSRMPRTYIILNRIFYKFL